MKRLVLVAALVVVGCERPTEAFAPEAAPPEHDPAEAAEEPPYDGAVRFEPTYANRVWYEDAEKCSGFTGDFESVRWFHMDEIPTDPDREGEFLAPNTIVIRSDMLHVPRLFMHESLHHVFELHGMVEHRTHDLPDFERCVPFWEP